MARLHSLATNACSTHKFEGAACPTRLVNAFVRRAWLAVDCQQPLAVVNVCRQSSAARLTDGWTKPRS